MLNDLSLAIVAIFYLYFTAKKARATADGLLIFTVLPISFTRGTIVVLNQSRISLWARFREFSSVKSYHFDFAWGSSNALGFKAQ